YRLVPDFHFPAQFEDILRATKHFLLPDVLAQYSVDPARIAVSGDSAGGNLAAAVCQEVRKVLGDLHTDPSSTVQKVPGLGLSEGTFVLYGKDLVVNS
ncbi:putative Neutral cholesterol ester hydrolase 1 protein, partial [Naja naja]